MPFLVQTQVVGSGEAALTDLAGERLVAGVLAVVAGELVASCETPVATFERALVWFLSCGIDGEGKVRLVGRLRFKKFEWNLFEFVCIS